VANPFWSTYLQANNAYTWANGDVYEINAQDDVEGAATGASFSGIGVSNQPHQFLLNKVQWLYNRISGISTGLHGLQNLTFGSGNFIVPAGITALLVIGWGYGGQGGYSTGGYITGGGGGGGAGCFIDVLTVTPAQSIAWSVGGGGSAFGPDTATSGGPGNAAGFTQGLGGYGGAAGGAAIVFPGTGGEFGRTILDTGGHQFAIGGEGGASFGCGHSHFTWFGGGASNGQNGIYPGQGGGGGVGGGAGGAGGPGMIVVIY